MSERETWRRVLQAANVSLVALPRFD